MNGIAFALMLAANATDSGVENAQVLNYAPTMELCEIQAELINNARHDAYAYCLKVQDPAMTIAFN